MTAERAATERDALSLLTAQAVRERATMMLDVGLADGLTHFRIDLARMDDVVDAVLVQQLGEGADVADAHQVIQLLARIREVLAQMVVDRHTQALQLGLENLRDQRHAAAAGRARFGAALEVRDGLRAFDDGRAQLALAHVVARAQHGALD